MRAITQKVTFKLKKNKSETQQAIMLTQLYSANMRELYQLISYKDKLPKHKMLPKLHQQLNKLQQNMRLQLKLYQPYENKRIQQLLLNMGIPNAESLISLYQQRKNQIDNIRRKLSSQTQQIEKKSNIKQKQQQIRQLRQQLQQETRKKAAKLNKIEKIKEQLEQETKAMIESKIDNFDREIQYRKLQQQTQLQLQQHQGQNSKNQNK